MNTRYKAPKPGNRDMTAKSTVKAETGRTSKQSTPGIYWRPQQSIQTKVIGICINRRRLLAAEVYDDTGQVKGVRPLGGHVEFGETRDKALKREFREELGTDIVTAGQWRTYENIFKHEGQLGHEFIHAISVALVDKSLYEQPLMVFSEDSGSDVRARWFSVRDLRNGELALFPDGLSDSL